MIEVTFPISASCGWWHGDNDIDITLTEEEYEILKQTVSAAAEEGWSHLDEDGPCANLFPRIREAVLESLEEAELDLDLDDVEFAVHLPENM